MEISSIRENIKARIFNSTKHETTVSRQSNPFSRTSFKGNVLTADVFESASKIAEKSLGKNKLTMSALVGSLSNFGSRLQAGVESVVAFGRRMKDGVVSAWNKLDSIKILPSLSETCGMVAGKINSMIEPTNAKHLAKTKSVDELGNMLIDSIAEYERIAA